MFTSLPAGCGRRSRRGRREGVNAYGAAAQAAIVTGEGSPHVLGFLLLDVTPLSMCLETSLRVATKLYERNTDNLTKSGQTSRTCADNGPGVLTRVLEREHVTAQDDNLLEKLHPQFDHDDANRISNVSAQGETSDNEAMDWTTKGVMTQVRNQKSCIVRVGSFQQRCVSGVLGRSLLEIC